MSYLPQFKYFISFYFEFCFLWFWVFFFICFLSFSEFSNQKHFLPNNYWTDKKILSSTLLKVSRCFSNFHIIKNYKKQKNLIFLNFLLNNQNHVLVNSTTTCYYKKCFSYAFSPCTHRFFSLSVQGYLRQLICSFLRFSPAATFTSFTFPPVSSSLFSITRLLPYRLKFGLVAHSLTPLCSNIHSGYLPNNFIETFDFECSILSYDELIGILRSLQNQMPKMFDSAMDLENATKNDIIPKGEEKNEIDTQHHAQKNKGNERKSQWQSFSEKRLKHILKNLFVTALQNDFNMLLSDTCSDSVMFPKIVPFSSIFCSLKQMACNLAPVTSINYNKNYSDYANHNFLSSPYLSKETKPFSSYFVQMNNSKIFSKSDLKSNLIRPITGEHNRTNKTFNYNASKNVFYALHSFEDIKKNDEKNTKSLGKNVKEEINAIETKAEQKVEKIKELQVLSEKDEIRNLLENLTNQQLLKFFANILCALPDFRLSIYSYFFISLDIIKDLCCLAFLRSKGIFFDLLDLASPYYNSNLAILRNRRNEMYNKFYCYTNSNGTVEFLNKKEQEQELKQEQEIKLDEDQEYEEQDIEGDLEEKQEDRDPVIGAMNKDIRDVAFVNRNILKNENEQIVPLVQKSRSKEKNDLNFVFEDVGQMTKVEKEQIYKNEKYYCNESLSCTIMRSILLDTNQRAFWPAGLKAKDILEKNKEELRVIFNEVMEKQRVLTNVSKKERKALIKEMKKNLIEDEEFDIVIKEQSVQEEALSFSLDMDFDDIKQKYSFIEDKDIRLLERCFKQFNEGQILSNELNEKVEFIQNKYKITNLEGTFITEKEFKAEEETATNKDDNEIQAQNMSLNFKNMISEIEDEKERKLLRKKEEENLTDLHRAVNYENIKDIVNKYKGDNEKYSKDSEFKVFDVWKREPLEDNNYESENYFKQEEKQDKKYQHLYDEIFNDEKESQVNDNDNSNIDGHEMKMFEEERDCWMAKKLFKKDQKTKMLKTEKPDEEEKESKREKLNKKLVELVETQRNEKEGKGIKDKRYNNETLSKEEEKKILKLEALLGGKEVTTSSIFPKLQKLFELEKNSKTELGENFKALSSIPLNRRAEEKKTNLEQFDLNKNLIDGVREVLGDEDITFTPTQEFIIPKIMNEKSKNLCFVAQTGTGKTLSYLIPIMNILQIEKERREESSQFVCANSVKEVSSNVKKENENRSGGHQCLILAPTKILSNQIYEVTKTLSKHTNLIVEQISGDKDRELQKQNLRKNVDIVVGTPSRIVEMKNQNFLLFNNLKFIVVDEFDAMLLQGFEKELEDIFSKVMLKSSSATSSSNVLEQHKNQNSTRLIMVSATLPPNLKITLEKKFSYDIKIYETSEAHTLPSSVQHIMISTTVKDKLDCLLDALRSYCSFDSSVIIFCNTVENVKRCHSFLRFNQINSLDFHGEMNNEERMKNFDTFKKVAKKIKVKKLETNKASRKKENKTNEIKGNCLSEKLNVLVCTDIASRGIDFKEIKNMILFDFPYNPIDYLHRCGRINESKGKIISLILKQDKTLAFAIKNAIKNNFPLINLSSNKADYAVGGPLRYIKETPKSEKVRRVKKTRRAGWKPPSYKRIEKTAGSKETYKSNKNFKGIGNSRSAKMAMHKNNKRRRVGRVKKF